MVQRIVDRATAPVASAGCHCDTAQPVTPPPLAGLESCERREGGRAAAIRRRAEPRGTGTTGSSDVSCHGCSRRHSTPRSCGAASRSQTPSGLILAPGGELGCRAIRRRPYTQRSKAADPAFLERGAL